MGNETVQNRRKTNRNSFSVDFGHELPSKIKPNNVMKLMPINEPKQRSQSVIEHSYTNQGQGEGLGYANSKQTRKQDQYLKRESSNRLKKLNQTNDQLRKQLIKISGQLTQKLKKKKFQVKKVEQIQPNLNKKQSLKRQLQNGYKQIDMYKKILSDLKIGEQSQGKLLFVQDKINSIDIEIQKTQKQIQAIKNVNTNQSNGIRKETDKGSQALQQLKSEIESLKQTIKQKSKDERNREKKYMQQHHYMKVLEEKVKEVNELEEEDQSGMTKDKGKDKITQEELALAEEELLQVKVKHDEYHKKINGFLVGNKILKEKRIVIKNQLDQKIKLIDGLKYKRDALVKLIKDNLHLFATKIEPKQQQLSQFNSDEEQSPDPIQQQQNQRGTFDIQHLKDHQLKNLQKKISPQPLLLSSQPTKSQPKQWKKHLFRTISKGKSLPDQKTFITLPSSVSSPLSSSSSLKIIQLQMWMNKKKQLTSLQPLYLHNGNIVQGNKSSKNLQDEYRVTFQLSQSDYLKTMIGIIGKSGYLQYLVLQSNMGKIAKIGRQQTDGDNFAIGVTAQETPICISGANRYDGAYWRISRLDIDVVIQYS